MSNLIIALVLAAFVVASIRYGRKPYYTQITRLDTDPTPTHVQRVSPRPRIYDQAAEK